MDQVAHGISSFQQRLGSADGLHGPMYSMKLAVNNEQWQQQQHLDTEWQDDVHAPYVHAPEDIHAPEGEELQHLLHLLGDQHQRFYNSRVHGARSSTTSPSKHMGWATAHRSTAASPASARAAQASSKHCAWPESPTVHRPQFHRSLSLDHVGELDQGVTVVASSAGIPAAATAATTTDTIGSAHSYASTDHGGLRRSVDSSHRMSSSGRAARSDTLRDSARSSSTSLLDTYFTRTQQASLRKPAIKPGSRAAGAQPDSYLSTNDVAAADTAAQQAAQSARAPGMVDLRQAGGTRDPPAAAAGLAEPSSAAFTAADAEGWEGTSSGGGGSLRASSALMGALDSIHSTGEFERLLQMQMYACDEEEAAEGGARYSSGGGVMQHAAVDAYACAANAAARVYGSAPQVYRTTAAESAAMAQGEAPEAASSTNGPRQSLQQLKALRMESAALRVSQAAVRGAGSAAANPLLPQQQQQHHAILARPSPQPARPLSAGRGPRASSASGGTPAGHGIHAPRVAASASSAHAPAAAKPFRPAGSSTPTVSRRASASGALTGSHQQRAASVLASFDKHSLRKARAVSAGGGPAAPAPVMHALAVAPAAGRVEASTTAAGAGLVQTPLAGQRVGMPQPAAPARQPTVAVHRHPAAPSAGGAAPAVPASPWTDDQLNRLLQQEHEQQQQQEEEIVEEQLQQLLLPMRPSQEQLLHHHQQQVMQQLQPSQRYLQQPNTPQHQPRQAQLQPGALPGVLPRTSASQLAPRAGWVPMDSVLGAVAHHPQAAANALPTPSAIAAVPAAAAATVGGGGDGGSGTGGRLRASYPGAQPRGTPGTRQQLQHQHQQVALPRAGNMGGPALAAPGDAGAAATTETAADDEEAPRPLPGMLRSSGGSRTAAAADVLKRASAPGAYDLRSAGGRQQPPRREQQQQPGQEAREEPSDPGLLPQQQEWAEQDQWVQPQPPPQQEWPEHPLSVQQRQQQQQRQAEPHRMPSQQVQQQLQLHDQLRQFHDLLRAGEDFATAATEPYGGADDAAGGDAAAAAAAGVDDADVDAGVYYGEGDQDVYVAACPTAAAGGSLAVSEDHEHDYHTAGTPDVAAAADVGCDYTACQEGEDTEDDEDAVVGAFCSRLAVGDRLERRLQQQQQQQQQQSRSGLLHVGHGHQHLQHALHPKDSRGQRQQQQQQQQRPDHPRQQLQRSFRAWRTTAGEGAVWREHAVQVALHARAHALLRAALRAWRLLADERTAALFLALQAARPYNWRLKRLVVRAWARVVAERQARGQQLLAAALQRTAARVLAAWRSSVQVWTMRDEAVAIRLRAAWCRWMLTDWQRAASVSRHLKRQALAAWRQHMEGARTKQLRVRMALTYDGFRLQRRALRCWVVHWCRQAALRVFSEHRQTRLASGVLQALRHRAEAAKLPGAESSTASLASTGSSIFSSGSSGNSSRRSSGSGSIGRPSHGATAPRAQLPPYPGAQHLGPPAAPSAYLYQPELMAAAGHHHEVRGHQHQAPVHGAVLHQPVMSHHRDHHHHHHQQRQNQQQQYQQNLQQQRAGMMGAAYDDHLDGYPDDEDYEEQHDDGEEALSDEMLLLLQEADAHRSFALLRAAWAALEAARAEARARGRGATRRSSSAGGAAPGQPVAGRLQVLPGSAAAADAAADAAGAAAEGAPVQRRTTAAAIAAASAAINAALQSAAVALAAAGGATGGSSAADAGASAVAAEGPAAPVAASDAARAAGLGGGYDRGLDQGLQAQGEPPFANALRQDHRHSQQQLQQGLLQGQQQQQQQDVQGEPSFAKFLLQPAASATGQKQQQRQQQDVQGELSFAAGFAGVRDSGHSSGSSNSSCCSPHMQAGFQQQQQQQQALSPGLRAQPLPEVPVAGAAAAVAGKGAALAAAFGSTSGSGRDNSNHSSSDLMSGRTLHGSLDLALGSSSAAAAGAPRSPRTPRASYAAAGGGAAAAAGARSPRGLASSPSAAAVTRSLQLLAPGTLLSLLEADVEWFDDMLDDMDGGQAAGSVAAPQSPQQRRTQQALLSPRSSAPGGAAARTLSAAGAGVRVSADGAPASPGKARASGSGYGNGAGLQQPLTGSQQQLVKPQHMTGSQQLTNPQQQLVTNPPRGQDASSAEGGAPASLSGWIIRGPGGAPHAPASLGTRRGQASSSSASDASAASSAFLAASHADSAASATSSSGPVEVEVVLGAAAYAASPLTPLGAPTGSARAGAGPGGGDDPADAGSMQCRWWQHDDSITDRITDRITDYGDHGGSCDHNPSHGSDDHDQEAYAHDAMDGSGACAADACDGGGSNDGAVYIQDFLRGSPEQATSAVSDEAGYRSYEVHPTAIQRVPSGTAAAALDAVLLAQAGSGSSSGGGHGAERLASATAMASGGHHHVYFGPSGAQLASSQPQRGQQHQQQAAAAAWPEGMPALRPAELRLLQQCQRDLTTALLQAAQQQQQHPQPQPRAQQQHPRTQQAAPAAVGALQRALDPPPPVLRPAPQQQQQVQRVILPGRASTMGYGRDSGASIIGGSGASNSASGGSSGAPLRTAACADAPATGLPLHQALQLILQEE